MRKFIVMLLACTLLVGCVMRLGPEEQYEELSVKYHEKLGVPTAEAVSSSGERFTGILVYTQDPKSSHRYRGSLPGDKGRTIFVDLECNPATFKCVGTAKADNGDFFNIY